MFRYQKVAKGNYFLNMPSQYKLFKFHNHLYSNLPVHMTAVPKFLPVVLHFIFFHIQRILSPQRKAVSLRFI